MPPAAHDSPFLTPELMESQGRALRKLAIRLLGDEHQAADAVQQTWLTAMESPPGHGGALAWLRVVTQNVCLTMLRSRERRQRRELASALDEALPGTDEVVARGDLMRTVADTVMQLKDPYRSTLIMRYYEGRTTEEIAKLERVSPATVRSRVHRGLGQLRELLDEHRRWGEKKWKRALLPLVALDGWAEATSTGAWLGSLTAKLSIAGAVLGAGLWLGWDRWSGSSGPGSVARAKAEPAVAAIVADPERAAIVGPIEDAARDLREPAAEAELLPARYSVRGVVVDPEGRSVEGARVEFNHLRALPSEGFFTGPDGSFEILSDSPIRNLVARSVELGSSGLYEVFGADSLTLTLSGTGGIVSGRVLDETGQSVAGALVRVGSRSFGLGVIGRDDQATSSAPFAMTRTDADGAYEVLGIPFGRHTVFVIHDEWAPWNGEVDLSEARAVLDPELTRGVRLTGRVVDQSGQPMVDAWVGLSPADPMVGAHARTDANGEFDLSGLPAGRCRVAVRTGALYADRLLPRESRPGDTYAWHPVLSVGGVIRLRVEDESGAPLDGWTVWVDWNPEHENEGKLSRAQNHWMSLFLRRTPTRTDAEGRVQVSYPVATVPTRVRVVGPQAHWPIDEASLRLSELDGREQVLRVRRPEPRFARLDLLDPTGMPLRPAEVIVRHESGDRRVSVPFEIEADGEGLRAGPLPSGTYEWFVTTPRQRQVFLGRHRVLGGSELTDLGELVLPTFGKLEVEWRGESDPRGVVEVWSGEGGVSAAAKAFAIERGLGSTHLAPGRYRLRLREAQDVPEEEFEIQSDQTTRILLVPKGP